MREEYGFTRQNWFEPVGEECKALRAGAGVIDISNFAKYEIKGEKAADWLNHVVANRVPMIVGRSCLTPVISVRGGIAGDFTITKLADDHFMMFGSGPAERYHKRFFNMVDLPEGVTFESLTDSHCGCNLAGPNAREILSRLSPDEDLSNEDFRFMRSRRMKVAKVDALVLRVSFSGELGYEIYTKEADQVAVYEAILERGKDLGIRPVGSRALLSLRVEKGYGSWGREYSSEYWPQESGMAGLIKLDKEEDFLNKEAYLKIKDKAPRVKLVSFTVDTPHNADAVGGEPIFALDGTPVGQVSSGAYGHTVATSLALGYLNREYIKPGAEFDIAILGIPHRAKLLDTPAFDPKGIRLRG